MRDPHINAYCIKGGDLLTCAWQWANRAEMKPKVPNGQLPVMTLEDGSMVPESGAIMR